MANCLYKYLHDSYTTKIDFINHAFAKLVVAWLYMGLGVTKPVFRVIDTQTSLLTGLQIYGGRGSLSHDFFFLSIFTGSLIHEHYTRECGFGNFDKIKNKNNTKKKTQKKQTFG